MRCKTEKVIVQLWVPKFKKNVEKLEIVQKQATKGLVTHYTELLKC